MTQYWSKNETMKKVHFYKDQEWNKGEGRCDLLHDEFFMCWQSKSFLDTLFFQFGISIDFVIPKEEFKKEKLHGGIKLIL